MTMFLAMTPEIC